MEKPASPASSPSKSTWIWVIGAVVIIGIIVALTSLNNDTGDRSEDASADNTISGQVESEEETDATSTASLVAASDPDSSLRYTAALTKYGTRRIAFDSRCLATPARATFAAGTKIMLDNRGSQAARIVVGDSAFSIPAYNFSFVTLSDVSGSSYSIDCGTNRGAATITVSK